MIQEIVQQWISELIKRHNVSKLEDLTKSAIDDEIKESEINIDICIMQQDELGIACNKYYIECLNDALAKKIEVSRQFTIRIIGNEVYLNDKLHICGSKMDKEDENTDTDKRAILVLVNEMGYEPVPLFEEMVDRLNEMLDEL